MYGRKKLTMLIKSVSSNVVQNERTWWYDPTQHQYLSSLWTFSTRNTFIKYLDISPEHLRRNILLWTAQCKKIRRNNDTKYPKTLVHSYIVSILDLRFICYFKIGQEFLGRLYVQEILAHFILTMIRPCLCRTFGVSFSLFYYHFLFFLIPSLSISHLFTKRFYSSNSVQCTLYTMMCTLKS